LNHLADLLVGAKAPESEADREFLTAVKQVIDDKKFQDRLRESYARNIELRMPFRPQVPEGIEQGSSPMSNLSEDV
jgi:hypothetical protein